MAWQRAADTAATTAQIWKPPIDALFVIRRWMLNVGRFLRLCRHRGGLFRIRSSWRRDPASRSQAGDPTPSGIYIVAKRCGVMLAFSPHELSLRVPRTHDLLRAASCISGGDRRPNRQFPGWHPGQLGKRLQRTASPNEHSDGRPRRRWRPLSPNHIHRRYRPGQPAHRLQSQPVARELHHGWREWDRHGPAKYRNSHVIHPYRFQTRHIVRRARLP